MQKSSPAFRMERRTASNASGVPGGLFKASLGEGELFVLPGADDPVARLDGAVEQLVGEAVLDLRLDRPAQRRAP